MSAWIYLCRNYSATSAAPTQKDLPSLVKEEAEILVMDLEETEFRNDCAGEGQQQFNHPTNRLSKAYS
jgi:hypothetical protein